MVSMTSFMSYQLNNLSTENKRISYQMSTGNILKNGSDDAKLYSKVLDINDNIRKYEGIATQIEQKIAFNDMSDSTLAQIKEDIEDIKVEIIKALNTGIDSSDMEAMAINIKGIKEDMLTLANTSVNGEYLYSGSDSSITPFVEDPDTGKIVYQGNNTLRNVTVEIGTSKEIGVTGYDILMYTTDSATSGETLSFEEGEYIIDSDSNEWKFIDTDNDGNIDYDALYKNGDINSSSITVTSDGSTPPVYTTDTLTESGITFTAKQSYFDDLDDLMNTLNGVDTDGITAIDDELQTERLQEALTTINTAYDAANIAHGTLGGRNSIIELAQDRVSTKLTHYNTLLSETNGADLSKLAIESQELELLYTSLYSSISKMYDMSLINFVK